MTRDMYEPSQKGVKTKPSIEGLLDVYERACKVVKTAELNGYIVPELMEMYYERQGDARAAVLERMK